MEKKTTIFLSAALIAASLALGLWLYHPSINIPSLPSPAKSQERTLHRPATGLKEYQRASFKLANVKGISSNQLEQHQQLYAGYVKKRNEIARRLETVNRANSASRTYSPFRSLKLAETYAVNGSILHELYFGNISQPGKQPGPLTLELIEENFGSFEKFKQDLMDCGGVSRGWAVTSYNIDDGLLHNYVFEEHNQHVPVLTIPLLVLDVYEHAYMIDFGIKRDPYLDAFWNNIDWDVVEQRIEKWVQPLRT